MKHLYLSEMSQSDSLTFLSNFMQVGDQLSNRTFPFRENNVVQ